MEFYFRAKLLKHVIDVLADYIEAENIPTVKEVTQRRAREIHLRAYPEYIRRIFNCEYLPSKGQKIAKK